VNADEPIRPDRSAPLVPESTGSGTSGIDSLDADWSADGGHLGWRLSALLDGELPVPDELRAREHLSGCDFCQDEFTEVMSARAFVRGLGDVEPPQGYVDRILTRIHRRNQVRFGLASLVGIAAIWIVVLIIAAGVVVPSGTPDIDELGAHHGLAAAGDANLDDATPIDDLAALDAPYVLPGRVASVYEREAAWDRNGHGVHGLYRSDTATVSVFEQAGTLDWDSLPEDGTVQDVGGERVWTTTISAAGGPERHVAVVTRYPVVYTIVSTDSAESVLDVAGDLPEPRDFGWADRLRTNLDRWF
jgi:hypothetical protein